MQTRRDYLVGLGLAKPGRGKFSTAAKDALDKARAAGTKFSDEVTETPVPTESSDKTERVGKTAPTFTPYLAPSDFRFPESEYKAKGGDGKTYGMRECCNLCRVSLVNHGCDNPTILGGIAVKIVKK